MNKIWTITLKELRGTFQDRSLLLIMFAAPVAIATIIAVTFGNIGADTPPVQDIPVAIVNLDEGNANVNNGVILTGILTGEMTAANAASGTGDAGAQTTPVDCPSGESATAASSTASQELTGSDTTSSAMTLENLLEPTVLDDPAAARAGVEAGDYAAAVIIPANFTTSLGYTATDQSVDPTQIEVYANPENPIAGEIVRGVVDGIGTQLATVNIALAATLDTVSQNYGLVRMVQVVSSPEFTTTIQCAVNNSTAPITIDRQTVSGDALSFNPLVLFGASQAIFFALFTANGYANTIIEERRNWTLQRMLISPTTRTQILLGKMGGVFINVLVQLVLLFGAFTVIGSLLAGEFQFIWGRNILAIIVILLATALAVTGLGSIVAAASSTPEQSNVIGTVVAMGMALVGGSFGFSLPSPLPYLSVVYWGTDAFTQLAAGQDNIVLGAVILLVAGIVTFGLALWLFDRRLSE
jgi:ABC-type Na+ efflux pump permease subunit